MIEQTGSLYDVFISYSHADQEWVRNWLLPRLEAADLHTCIDYRDFDVGVPSLVNMERSVSNSRHTLLVLTPAWIQSDWTEFEALLVQTSDLAGRHRRLLPLLLQPCEPPLRIAMLTYADFTKISEHDSQLKRLVKAVHGQLQLRDLGPSLNYLVKSGTSPFLVPFPHNPDFVGRDVELTTLHEMIQQGKSPVGIRPTVLVGLGGIGKTQLAVEYAHTHRADYIDGIFWLNAVNPLLHEFASLAETLGLADIETPRDQAAHKSWEYLDTRPNALVIFDNVLEPADLNIPFAFGLIPANLRCRTLFTTRQRDFPRTFQPFEVKMLPEMAAMRLLLRARPEILAEHHPEWGIARIICASLGWLPLALELAAAYLAEYQDVALSDYLDRLRTEGKLETVDDTELRPEDLPTRHDIAVKATLQTQWTRLDDKDAQLVFRAAGQFPEAAWIPVVRLGLLTGIEAGVFRSSYPTSLNRALRKLHDVSLVEELTNDRLRLHPLVHDFAAKLLPTAFHLEMASRMAAAFSDILCLEANVIQRGVDEVLDDLRTGLGFCANAKKNDHTYVQLSGLERTLDREAHCLREWNPPRPKQRLGFGFAINPEPLPDAQNWDPYSQRGFFLQQFRNRCLELNLPRLQRRAEARLDKLRLPYLHESFRVGHESESLVRTLTGHTDPVIDVAVTSDDRYIISLSNDKTIKVWGLATGQIVRTFEVASTTKDSNGPRLGFGLKRNLERSGVHTGRVVRVDVIPDSNFAISASYDGTLKVWDWATGQIVHTLEGHRRRINDVALTLNGRYAISASGDRTIKVWDLMTAQVVRAIEGHTKEVDDIAVTPDGRYIISASWGDLLRVWDLDTGQFIRTLEGHTQRTVKLGDFYVAMLDDKTLQVWDSSAQLVDTLEGYMWQELAPVAVTPDGRFAVCAGLISTSAFYTRKYMLYVWEISTGRCVQKIEGHKDRVSAVTVIPDGRSVISASVDGVLNIWELATGKAIQTLKGHYGSVNALAVTRDGQFVVSASSDCTLKVWDLANANAILGTPEGHTGPVVKVVITPDNRYAISASADTTLKIWNLKTGRVVRTLQGHMCKVNDIAVTPDSHYIISASDDLTIKVWDLTTAQLIRTLEGHAGRVKRVVVTPDSRYAISLSDSISESDNRGNLRVWDLTTGQVVCTLEGHGITVNDVIVTPDGHHLISSGSSLSNFEAKIWDITTWQVVKTLTSHVMGITPDGNRYINISSNEITVLSNPINDTATWDEQDLVSSQIIQTLKGHTEHITDVAITTDSHFLTSVSYDRTLKIWELTMGQVILTLVSSTPMLCCAIVPGERLIVAGDTLGGMHFIEWVNYS